MALIVAGCGHREPASGHSTASGGAAVLNTATVADVVAALRKAGLPVTGPRDVSQSKCPSSDCVNAVEAQEISVFKFASTGAAERFVGSHTYVYAVEDIALAFGPAMTADEQTSYERVVASVVAH